MKSFLDRFRRKGTDEGDPKTSESPGDVEQEVAKESLASGELAASDPVPSEEEAIRETPPAPLREEIATFVLGDFLKRIPEQLLAKGPHDETLPLAFDVSDLSSRIARGQTTLSLAEIYKRAFGHDLAPEIEEARKAPLQQRTVDFLTCKQAPVLNATFLDGYSEMPPRLAAKTGHPTLVVVAGKDEVVPDLAKRLPSDVKPVVIDGADHFFHDLYGEDAADAVAKFLKAE